MKKIILSALLLTGVTGIATAQDLKTGAVPAAVKSALSKKYPQAGKVGREKKKEILRPIGAVNPGKVCLSNLRPTAGL